MADIQFGFRSRCSTTDALMYFDYLIAAGLDTCPQVFAIFFDVSKAFDSVPHKALIECLRNTYKLPDFLLLLIQNYLSNRTQVVRVSDTLSQSRVVRSGVAQGSVIGPLLFAAYMNTVTNITLSKQTKLVLYADDLVIVHSLPAKSSCVPLQNDINLVASHISTTKLLKLNSSKTKTLLFLRNHGATLNRPQLLVENDEIEYVETAKYLGVTFDPYLTYSTNTNLLIAKTKKLSGYICRALRNCATKRVLTFLYTTVIRASLIYSCESAYPVNITDRVKFERAQKYVCRRILGNYIYSTSYSSMLTDLRLQSLYRTVFTRRLLLIYSYIHKLRHFPADILKFVRSSHSRSSSRLTHKYTLVIPPHRIQQFYTSALISTMVAFNFLSVTNISKSKISFCNYIKTDSCFIHITNSIEHLKSKFITIAELYHT